MALVLIALGLLEAVAPSSQSVDAHAQHRRAFVSPPMGSSCCPAERHGHRSFAFLAWPAPGYRTCSRRPVLRAYEGVSTASNFPAREWIKSPVTGMKYHSRHPTGSHPCSCSPPSDLVSAVSPGRPILVGGPTYEKLVNAGYTQCDGQLTLTAGAAVASGIAPADLPSETDFSPGDKSGNANGEAEILPIPYMKAGAEVSEADQCQDDETYLLENGWRAIHVDEAIIVVEKVWVPIEACLRYNHAHPTHTAQLVSLTSDCFIPTR